MTILNRLAKLPPFSYLPYFMDHLVIAGLISLAAVGAAGFIDIPAPLTRADAILAGPLFYAIREFIQWRQKGYFDRRGFLYPMLPLSLFWIVVRFWGL